RLVFVNPVRLGFGLNIRDRTRHPHHAKRQPPQPAYRLHADCPPLIEPDHRRAERISVAIQVDDRPALRGDRHPLDGGFGNIRLLPELLARLAQRRPEVLRLLLCPPRLLRKIRLDRHARLGEDVAIWIDQQRAHALRPVVDREDHVIDVVRHCASFSEVNRYAATALPCLAYPNPRISLRATAGRKTSRASQSHPAREHLALTLTARWQKPAPQPERAPPRAQYAGRFLPSRPPSSEYHARLAACARRRSVPARSRRLLPRRCHLLDPSAATSVPEASRRQSSHAYNSPFSRTSAARSLPRCTPCRAHRASRARPARPRTHPGQIRSSSGRTAPPRSPSSVRAAPGTRAARQTATPPRPGITS